jgi:hypothetical protein
MANSLTQICRGAEQLLEMAAAFLLLIYATIVVYFFYAPWNYLLLAALFFRRSPLEEVGRPVDTR